MKNTQSSLWFANKTLFLVLVLVASIGVANAAFNSAPANPPSSNTAEPLNTSAVDQSKSGKLKLGASSAPGATLDVQGNVKIVDGTQGAGKVLTSDANGVATWQGSSGSSSNADGPSFSAYRTTNSLSLPAGETVIAYDSVLNPYGNNDPCAFVCVNGPWGYSSSTNSFKPSVPGRYLLSATNRVWIAANLAGEVELRLYKNSTLVKQSVARLLGDDQHYFTMNVSAVLDANGTSDTFSVRIYNPSAGNAWLYGDANGRTAYFNGSRIGAPLNIQPTQTVISPVPPQAVMFFASADPGTATGCPSGWDLATNLNGMYVVGTTDKTKIGLSPAGATALSNQENRNNPGPHTHTYVVSDHAHYASVSGAMPPHRHYTSTNYGGSLPFTYGGNASLAGSYLIGLTPSGSYAEMFTGYQIEYYSGGNTVSSAGWTGGMNTGAGTFNSGAASVSSTVTNAPYVQLLACKKS